MMNLWKSLAYISDLGQASTAWDEELAMLLEELTEQTVHQWLYAPLETQLEALFF